MERKLGAQEWKGQRYLQDYYGNPLLRGMKVLAYLDYLKGTKVLDEQHDCRLLTSDQWFYFRRKRNVR